MSNSDSEMLCSTILQLLCHADCPTSRLQANFKDFFLASRNKNCGFFLLPKENFSFFFFLFFFHTGFFNMWGFGRANKQANQAKKVQENTPMHFLELVGDLIGHSSAVQVGQF